MKRRRSALDVGSNTIRLLVADVDGNDIAPVVDDSEFVRLGLDVDATGRLRDDRQDAALAAIHRLAARAAEAGAPDTVAIATSAVRDAINGEAFAERVRRETGINLQIISGEREASLTYRGATSGVAVGGGVIVCDIGGGSAEIVHGDESGIRWSSSLPLGSGRLSERFVHHDPPAVDEIDALKDFVRVQLAALPAADTATLIFTGGTATHVALLAGEEGPTATISIRAVGEVATEVDTVAAAQIVEKFGIRPERARVLPAGVATLQTVAGQYGAPEIVISRRGIREGALLDST
ncbi:MAG TPA: hypothetical protein VKX16_04400 [Chloroflexota bacterium]|nr:hypothetical protein [Chloroflexota bacterium]